MSHWLIQQNAAESAARIAGKILQDWSTRFSVREKGKANLVTEADFAAQQAIYDHLHAQFGEDNFLGEEDQPFPKTNSPFRWIVDPLDGTTNYVHRFPYYAVSIGLEYAGELVVGVIYDPTRDEMFSAAKGSGATLNGKTLAVSQVATIGEAFIMSSLPLAAEADHPSVQRFLRLLPLAQTVQRSGSAALNLANVAAGRVDGFWSVSLKPWDMAAGVVLVREAGGQIGRLDGRPFLVDEPNLLATSQATLHQELTSLLSLPGPPATR